MNSAVRTPAQTYIARWSQWAGLHFRTADVQAELLGRSVAEYMADNYFQPVGRKAATSS